MIFLTQCIATNVVVIWTQTQLVLRYIFNFWLYQNDPLLQRLHAVSCEQAFYSNVRNYYITEAYMLYVAAYCCSCWSFVLF